MLERRILFIMLFYSSLSFDRSITLKGNVKDSLQNPLSYANIIAKPVDVTKNLLIVF